MSSRWDFSGFLIPPPALHPQGPENMGGGGGGAPSLRPEILSNPRSSLHFAPSPQGPRSPGSLSCSGEPWALTSLAIHPPPQKGSFSPGTPPPTPTQVQPSQPLSPETSDLVPVALASGVSGIQHDRE